MRRHHRSKSGQSKSGIFGNRNSKKRSLRGTQRRPLLSLEALESRNMMAVLSFQEGVSGYTGTQDAIIYSITADNNFGTETGMSVDQQDVAGVRQGLLKFGDIFTSSNEPGKIPLGSTINSATLKVTVFNDSNSGMQMSMYRMLENWSELETTWNAPTFASIGAGRVGGVQSSEGESEGLPPDAILLDSATTVAPTTTNGKSFNVTTSLRHWAAGEDNFGWLIESAATNGWDLNTSEAAVNVRPYLEVDYTPPSLAGAGEFRFLNLAPIVGEGNSGEHTHMLTVARVGGSAGTVTVDFDIIAGTGAVAGADFVADNPANDTLTFNPGETIKSIPVTIKGDTLLEGIETVLVTLTNNSAGTTIAAGAGTATLSIGDDDALINEVVANISSTTGEGGLEYIELIGTPGASLAGYYFVVFEGEEEEVTPQTAAGNGIGRADYVIDLGNLGSDTGATTFGSNGLLVITGTTWGYQALKDAATNQRMTTRLNVDGLEDSSQTYALIYSPTNPIVETVDYDATAYENGLATAEGPGVGTLELLPAGAQFVDSVGVVEGGSGDRDRVATTVAASNPGIHVHQPDGPGGNVTSDAVTRRHGVTTPSSIGVWYNGDILNGTGNPIKYAEPSKSPLVTQVSVVAPAGAAITPGSHNILRNVAFDITNIEVDESAGTVTIDVTRLGDDNAVIDVNFSTANGTAISGQDFGTLGNINNITGTLHFAAGAANSTQTITISILGDVDVEGFENFSVNLTSATAPFVVITPTANVQINDGDVLVKSFQEDPTIFGGYEGTSDATIRGDLPNNTFGLDATVSVDQEIGLGAASRPSQGLLRFDDLFGSDADQVPLGSTIFNAYLTLDVKSASNGDASVRFFRMLQNWDEATTTWTDPQGSAGDNILNGVTPDGVESASTVDFAVTLPAGSGQINIPLNRDTVQAWANGSLANFGWSIVTDSGNNWEFASTQDFLSFPPFMPKLTILYATPATPPGSGGGAEAGGASASPESGRFGFTYSDYQVGENGTATIRVNRVGGSTGTVNLNYTISAGTGGISEVTNLTPGGNATGGTLTFSPGELFETITLQGANDSIAEISKTLNLTLSGVDVNLARSSATLTVRDNDFNLSSPAVLMSEVFINSPGNDGGSEFIELTGTAGGTMSSVYAFVIDGDTGPDEGVTDLVVDLGKFANGVNGHTVIGAQNGFDFNVPASATFIGRPELDLEIVANDSATYGLLYLPDREFYVGSFDYDWDNDGLLELPGFSEGVGELSNFVDSIGITDNGVTDHVYGPEDNEIDSDAHTTKGFYVPDAVSRQRGNTTRNNIDAWFDGDLIAVGDDPLVYDGPTPAPDRSTNLPVSGAAMTPGELNTGNSVQSPLVSLTAGPTGSVSIGGGGLVLNFTGPISQHLKVGTTPGITITNTSGAAIPGIDINPTIIGLGTNNLTVKFTGSAVIGGVLPTGTYRLNLLGNNLIGNGRAVDTNGGAADEFGSNAQYTFNQTAVAVLPGDYDRNGTVEQADHTFWATNFGATSGIGLQADGNNSGTVDASDYTIWRDNLGASLPGAGSGGGGLALAAAASEEPVQQSPSAVAEPTLDFVDLAFADLATTTLSAKAAGADAAASRRFAAGVSAPFDHSLLLAARRFQRATGPELEEARCAAHGDGEFDGVDGVFASLGKQSHFRKGVQKVV